MVAPCSFMVFHSSLVSSLDLKSTCNASSSICLSGNLERNASNIIDVRTECFQYHRCEDLVNH